MRHFRAYLENYQGFDVTKDHRQRILQIVYHIPNNFYIAEGNVEVIFTLLKNVVLTFDSRQYRMCNVVMGMKNTGKSLLVNTLRTAIDIEYPTSVTVLVDAAILTGTTINQLVVTACKSKKIDLGPSPVKLEDTIAHLGGRCQLLVIIDEAAQIYPIKNDDLPPATKSERIKRTERLITELHLLAQKAGCVCWLTSCSQVLYRLYSKGSHPNFMGNYSDLNVKKYSPLYYLALRDKTSVKELFQVARNQQLTDTQAAEHYRKYGGAIGDLLAEQALLVAQVLRGAELLMQYCWNWCWHRKATKKILGICFQSTTRLRRQ